MLDRTKMPAVAVPNFEMPTYEMQHLKNGMKVYFCKGGDQSVCKIEFVFSAGSKYQNKALVASMCNKMLREGTTRFSAKQIAQGLEYYGAHLVVAMDKDHATVSLYTLNEYISDTLPFVLSILTESSFPEKELKIKLNQEKNNFLVNQQKGAFVSGQLLYSYLFTKESVYYSNLEETDFEHVHKKDLEAFYHNFYNLSEALVLVSGQISSVEEERIGQALSKLELNNNNITKSTLVSNQSDERFVFKEQGSAIQSAIRIAGFVPGRTHPDFPLIELATTVLGGYFGSRLMTNIREDKGYTYGIGAGINALKEQSILSISTEVGVEVTHQTLVEIYKEVQDLKTNLMPQEELDRVKNYMMGNMARNFDGAFMIAEMLKSVLVGGMDFDFYAVYKDTLMRATPQEVMRIANTYFNKERWLEIVVGKK